MAEFPQYGENRVSSQRMAGDVHNSLSLQSGEMMAGSLSDPWQNPLTALVNRVDKAVDFYNGFLDEAGIDAHIDEIAVMFNRREEMWGWLMGAVKEPGVTIFNNARDFVHTHPIQSRYEVEYTFLRKNSLPWRVEAMLLTQGHSPLHHALAQNRVGGHHVVHASFKCRSLREWTKASEALAPDATLAQVCKSTYGRFSYWSIEESLVPEGIPEMYLKPRVNERDA